MDFPVCRISKSFSLPHHDVLQVSGFLEEHGIDYMVQKPVPETNHFLYSYHGGRNPDFHSRINLYGDFAAPLTRDGLLNFGDATQVLCIVPGVEGHQVAELLATRFQHLSVIRATSPLDHESLWIEIFSSSVSKSRAVEWLSSQIGLQRTRVCAVGNDYNDEDLLKWAGTSFVTANGPARLKSTFSTVSSNNDGGVTEAAVQWVPDYF